MIDFQNRQYTTTEAEFHENIAAREEFRMMDNGSDDEQEDLLGGMTDLERLKQAFTKRKSHFSSLLYLSLRVILIL